LRILDVKNLGQRTSLYVVAYRQQQFLIGGSSNGLNLLSTLDSDPSEGEEGDPGTEAGTPEPPPSNNAFRNALDQVLDKARSPSQ
jgi:flagellar biogenesis protein FliO